MNTSVGSTINLVLLFQLSSGFAVEQPENEVVEDKMEKITVISNRNQPYSEPTEETQKLLKVPGIMNDPLSAVFSMPGVVYSDGDAGSAPAVRGSSPDDNGFLIDNMPASYLFHFFGDSIFNENLIRDFSLHPAAFGAQYGNATGGVFDVKLRDPRQQDIKTIVDLSMLRTGVMVEGSTTKDQAFYLSYRHGLMHLFLPEGEGEGEDEGLNIKKAPKSSDYQAKYQWLIGTDHKLTLTATGAKDSGKAEITERYEEALANPDIVGNFHLKSKFDNQGLQYEYFGQTGDYLSINLSHVKTIEDEGIGAGEFITTQEKSQLLRALYQYPVSESHLVSAGLDLHQMNLDYNFDFIPYYCTDHQVDCESQKGERVQQQDSLKVDTAAIYLKDLWQINSAWQMELGIRIENQSYTKETFVMPRARISWQAANDLLLHTKAGRYSRFPNGDTVLKKIGNPALKSPLADHVAVGAVYELTSGWKITTDLYYKDLKKLPLALAENDPNYDLHYSNEMTGTAYGIETLLEKELIDSWYGWVSLSWSKSQRTNERTQKTTEYYLDTPLVMNAVANYKINNNWDIGLRLSVRSGAKYTPIIGLRENEDHPGYYLPQYGEHNSKNLPIYKRLDLQADYKHHFFGNKASFSMGLMNATGSDNISGYYYSPDKDKPRDELQIEGETGMDIFPWLSYKVIF